MLKGNYQMAHLVAGPKLILLRKTLKLTVLSALPFLYLIGLHSSIAIMEIVSWTAFLWILVLKGRRGEKFEFPREVLWAYGAFVVACGLSLWLNPPLRPFWLQFGFVRFGILLFSWFWLLQELWSETFERRLIRFWLVLIAICGLYGLFQCLTGIDLIRPGSGALRDQGGGVWKAPGFFSISLTYAYSLGLSLLAVSLPALKQARSTKERVLTIAALLLGMVGVIASMSRGAWLAMGLCIVFYLAWERRRWILPFLGLTALLALALTFLTSGFGDKILNLVEFKVDHSSAMRLDIWRAYWAMFLDHPIFGVGMFQGDPLLPEYYQRLGIVQPFISHAHNNFLQFLAGCGIVGELAFVWLISIFFRRAWSLRSRTVWGWSIFLALLFVFVGGLTEANFIDAEVNQFVVFLWAIVLALESRKV